MKKQAAAILPVRQLMHLGTRIQVVFCVPDEHGNAGQGIPVNLEVGRFDRQAWGDAFDMIQQERAKILAQLAGTPLTSAPIQAGEQDIAA